MSITLKVIRYQGQLGQQGVTAVFGRDGGRIGRADDNDLILVDPERYVSRHHARISYENGNYYLTDSSTGGTFIDEHCMPLQGKTAQLENGARLTMGEYELLVSIEETQQEKRRSEPEILPIHAANREAEVLMTGTDSVLDFGRFDTNPELLEGISATDAEDSIPEIELRANGTSGSDSLARLNVPIHDHFDPPVLRSTEKAGFAEIPENINVDDFFNDAPNLNSAVDQDDFEFSLGDDGISNDGLEPESASTKMDSNPEVQPTGPEHPFASKAENAENLPDSQRNLDIPDALSAFFEGASIKRGDIQDDLELLEKGGAMLRAMTEGIMSILRGRAEFKSQFRVPVTTIRAEDNNPLKFSPSTEIALKSLLFNGHPGFLDAIEAIEQGFDDAMNHQLALSAGIQAAVSAMMEQFDPARFEKQFENGVVFQKKAKCWDSYSKHYQRIAPEVADNFFGDAFVQAYEAQMKALEPARDNS